MTDATTTTTELDKPTLRAPEDIVRIRREIVVSSSGALLPKNFEEAMELSQAMAKAGVAVRAHLRGNPGACLAVIFYAMEWGLSPFGVANKSYSVNDQIAFEAQLLHAVIEMRAPLEERLKCRYEGEGDDMKCFVWAKCRGEEKPLEWESPRVGDIQPKRSPLWKSDVKQQLWYYTSRTWARRWFPEIILGLYTKDEMDDMSDEQRADMARDVTPTKTTLAERLLGTGDDREGFRPDDLTEVVENGLARPEQTQAEPEATTKPKATRTRSKPREEVVQPDSGSPTNSETTPPPAAAATEPAGADEASMQAQGRAALGDDPSKPQTPSGEEVAARAEVLAQARAREAQEASFVDLVTDAPAGLKDVTPPKTEPTLAKQPEVTAARQISTGEERKEPEPAPAKTEAPPPAKPKAEPPKTPRNPEEYFVHLKTWMNRTTDVGWVGEKYGSKDERDLRGKCGVIGEHAERAKKMRDDYIKTIS